MTKGNIINTMPSNEQQTNTLLSSSYRFLSKYNKNHIVFEPMKIALVKKIDVHFIFMKGDLCGRIKTKLNGNFIFLVNQNLSKEEQNVVLTRLLVYVEFFWVPQVSYLVYRSSFDVETELTSSLPKERILSKFVRSVLLPEPYLRFQWAIYGDIELLSFVFGVPVAMVRFALHQAKIVTEQSV